MAKKQTKYYKIAEWSNKKYIIIVDKKNNELKNTKGLNNIILAMRDNIKYITKKYIYKYKLEYDDLYQELYICLLKLLKVWDPKLCKWGTYFKKYIMWRFYDRLRIEKGLYRATEESLYLDMSSELTSDDFENIYKDETIYKIPNVKKNKKTKILKEGEQ